MADLSENADFQHREYLRGALRSAICSHANSIFHCFRLYEATTTASLVDSITEGANSIRLSEIETVNSKSTTEAKNYEIHFVKPPTCELMTLISKLIGIDVNVQPQRGYLISCRHIGKTDFVLKLKDLVLLCEEDKSWRVDLMAQTGPMKCAIAQCTMLGELE